MDPNNDYLKMLELLPQPAFAVKDGRILCFNRLAAPCLLDTETPVAEYLVTGKEEYEALTDGCLWLRLRLNGGLWDAAVTRLDGSDIFRLEHTGIPEELKAMALMGSQLRYPISNLSILTERHLADNPDIAAIRQELSRINRVLNNAANTERFLSGNDHKLQELNVCAILSELLEEAGNLLSQAGFKLESQLPDRPIFTLADEHGLRQAIYNLLSNAAKFSARGSTIRCEVRVSGKTLRITVSDEGEGVVSGQQAGVFNRFTRQPGIEEGRQNIGLGLALVRAVAAIHCGTVLLDNPNGRGTRVTMTLALRKSDLPILRSPNSLKLDSSISEGLTMLSDVLPRELYKDKL